jgi:uncharacterized membrane protein YbhN (UPF0104 family)
VNLSRLAGVALRVAVALLLLALACWAVGLQALARQLRQADPGWFAPALAAVAVSQWVSAARWTSIASILGLKAPAGALRLAYAQSMAVNVVLPGAVLGGDALRSVRLQRLGNPLGESALSVLLDRLSGLWVLCVLSLVTGVALMSMSAGGAAPATSPVADWVAWLYLAGLAGAAALPFVPLRLPARWLRAPDTAFGRLAARLAELHTLTLARRGPLARSLWSSIGVQLLCALALWLCLRAAGGTAGYWNVQAIAAPVFIAGVMPLSYGGFGARELVALLAFPLVGVDAQAGVAAAALYGLCAVCLGLAAAPLLALRPATSAAPQSQDGSQGFPSPADRAKSESAGQRFPSPAEREKGQG